MFGQQTTNAPSSGFSFGSTTAAKPGLFGSTTNTSSAGTLFGGAPPTASSSGGLFGSKPATTGAGGLFGAQTSTATTGVVRARASGGLFGAQTSTTPFGSTATSTAPPFGAPTTGTGMFGGQTGGGLFGATTSTAQGGFGTNTSTAAPGFSLGTFGKPASSQPSLFGPSAVTTATAAGQPQMHSMAAPPVPVQSLDAYHRALMSVQLYGDERDDVVANINQLNAKAGATAKAYHTASLQPLDLTPQSPFNHFQALVYNQIPGHADSDGLLGVIIGQPADKVSSQKQLIEDGLFKIMGSRPTLKAHVEAVRKLPDDQLVEYPTCFRCDVTIYITEQSATGVHRRIAASESVAFLQAQAQALSTQMNVINVYPKIGMDDNKLKDYLLTVPTGIPPLVWKQAKADNPDPAHLIPWPVRGFKELHERHNMQQQQAQQQNNSLQSLSSSCSKMAEKATIMQSRLTQMKAKQDTLTNRLLRIMSCQFERARIGRAFTVHEEQLFNRLQHFLNQLSSPAHDRAQLTELYSIVRCQPELLSGGSAVGSTNTTCDEDDDEDRIVDEELHRMLRKCADKIESMVKTVSSDVKSMKTMSDVISTYGR